jgi:hypothetical protein
VTQGIRIRHLTFTGPQKPVAMLEFGPGMNVLYGASDTGKSFVVNAIDFMLGGKGPLPDIPEREGYDRVLLGIENLGVSRSIAAQVVGDSLSSTVFFKSIRMFPGASFASSTMTQKTTIYPAFCWSRLA